MVGNSEVISNYSSGYSISGAHLTECEEIHHVRPIALLTFVRTSEYFCDHWLVWGCALGQSIFGLGATKLKLSTPKVKMLHYTGGGKQTSQGKF